MRVLNIILLFSLIWIGCATITPATAPASTGAPSSPEVAAPKPAAIPATPSPSLKASTEQPRYGGILNIGHMADPISYDPIQESSVQSMSLVGPCYSGIVQHDPLDPTKVIGDLAEKWDMSAEGNAYTFYLNKNVKLSDGNTLAAEDARFTLDVVRDPPKGIVSPRKEWLKVVDKVEARDKDTLRITLRYPSASFLHNLADGRLVMVSKQVFEAKGNLKKDIVGSGPYRFKSFTSGASFSVVKNPDYFIKGRPYLDGITWYIITDVATRFAALRTHRIAVTPWGSQGLTPSQAEVVRRDLGDKVIIDDYSSLAFWAFFMPLGKSPWNDIRVRRAVNLTIDRPKIIKVGAEGRAQVGAFMPPGAWSLPEEELLKMPGYRQPKDNDIAEAKKLMAEAGYAQGIKTTTIVRNDQRFERGAISVKEQLEQIGISVTVKLQDQGTMFDLLYKRNYESAVFHGTVSFDDPDQVFGQTFITGVPGNYSELSDEKIDKWFEEQARTMDPVKRKQIVLDMQRRTLELIPCSILLWDVIQLARWQEVKSLRAGVGVYNHLKFQDLWLAE